MVFAFQVWGTVSSEDFRATWGVEWGSVARWVVATTVHFEISHTVVLFNFIRIRFCEEVMRTFKKTLCRGSACRLFVHLYLDVGMVPPYDLYWFIFIRFSNQKWQVCLHSVNIVQCFTSSLIHSDTDNSWIPNIQHSLPHFPSCHCNWICLFE